MRNKSNLRKEVNQKVKENQKPCPPEMLEYCQRELEAIRLQINQSLEHLAKGETLAALGAWDGMEKRLADADCALQLIARLYPNTLKSQDSLEIE